MAGSISGLLGPSFGQPGAPGFIPGSVTAPVTQAGNTAEQAMSNRYAQLGLAAQGATPAQGGNLPVSPGGGLAQSTAALQDYGVLPSYAGGIAGEQQAVLGNLQNQSLSLPNPAGKNSSPASIIGAIGRGIGTIGG